MRVSSPPTTHPCYYGIDTPTRQELVAATHTLEETRTYITADSLAYLSREGCTPSSTPARKVLQRLLLRQLSVSFPYEEVTQMRLSTARSPHGLSITDVGFRPCLIVTAARGAPGCCASGSCACSSSCSRSGSWPGPRCSTGGALRDRIAPVEVLRDYNPSLVTKVYGADGSVIGEFFVERRVIIPLTRVPKILQDAFIAAEDASFFAHQRTRFQGRAPGDRAERPRRRRRAGRQHITQQVARNMFLSSERRLARKIKEAILATGSRSTSQAGHPRALPQPHLPRSGRLRRPGRSPDLLRNGRPISSTSRERVLAGLPKARRRYSPPSTGAGAQEGGLRARPHEPRPGHHRRAGEGGGGLPLRLRKAGGAQRGAFFLEYVRRALDKSYGSDAVYRGGLEVRTTSTPTAGRAEDAVRAGLARSRQAPRLAWADPAARDADAAKIEG